jgi:beta-1,2-mannobiose phosphorylase / 1,2-beta-oligomannan phosphorylase
MCGMIRPQSLPLSFILLTISTTLARAADAPPPTTTSTSAGWIKYDHNPVLGGKLGTCFDVAVLLEGNRYRMWFSWRPRKSIALVESDDGLRWSDPVIVLAPVEGSDWEPDVNRPGILKRDGVYHLWYTGQAKGRSAIGHATSPDGKTWTRSNNGKSVLSSQAKWEKVALMCPDVMWDDAAKQFRMWYSGGEQYEPDAIGYATSPDGDTWTRATNNPVFAADPDSPWEQHKVTACQVLRQKDGWHYMFYIGFRDVQHAQIGLARSRDGITAWQRHPANPIIRPTPNSWDHDAVYKPAALFDGTRWLLWYNGRKGGTEQVGVALHEGEDLGFPKAAGTER